MFPLFGIPNSRTLKHLWYQQLYVHSGSRQHNLPVQRLSRHWRTSGSIHTAAVGAGIGRKASQPLQTAMDRNCLLHCLLLVCSLHRVTMFPKYCLPACYSLNCSWCVGTLRVRCLVARFFDVVQMKIIVSMIRWLRPSDHHFCKVF